MSGVGVVKSLIDVVGGCCRVYRLSCIEPLHVVFCPRPLAPRLDGSPFLAVVGSGGSFETHVALELDVVFAFVNHFGAIDFGVAHEVAAAGCVCNELTLGFGPGVAAYRARSGPRLPRKSSPRCGFIYNNQLEKVKVCTA